MPKEHVLYFNLQEIHACYEWQAAATAAAELLIQQLDSGILFFREGIKHYRRHMVTRRRPLFHFPVAPRRQRRVLPERNRGRLRTLRVPRREAHLHLALPRRVLCVLEALGMDGLTGSWDLRRCIRLTRSIFLRGQAW